MTLKLVIYCDQHFIEASPHPSILTKTETKRGRRSGASTDQEKPIQIDVYTHESINVPGLSAWIFLYHNCICR